MSAIVRTRQDSHTLETLHPIFVPDPVAYWPPQTVGWYVLAAVLLLAILWMVVRRVRRWHRNRYRRVALASLGRLEAGLKAPDTRPKALLELTTLLKQVALHDYPRAEVAGLSGEPWLSFLSQTGRRTDFSSEAGRLLVTAPYRRHEEIEALPERQLAVLIRLTRRWIKRHRA